MVRFTFLRKHLGTIPPNMLLTDIVASAWDRQRQGYLQQKTIHQLRRTAQAVPTTPFGNRRLPLLPPTANVKRHYKPAPWHTPSQWSEDFLNLEGGDQGDSIPAANPPQSLEISASPLLPPPRAETGTTNQHGIKPLPQISKRHLGLVQGEGRFSN